MVLDGEAVAHCDKGLPHFHGLLSDGAKTACLYVFDILMLDGENLRPMPLDERRCDWNACSAVHPTRFGSATTWKRRTARQCSATPAGWASKGSSRSAETGAASQAGAGRG